MLNSKSITIMNQFTNQAHSSQGSTPANFVTSYMARNDATLTSYPVINPDQSTTWAPDPNSIYEKQRQILLKNRASLSKRRPTSKSWFNLTTLEGRAFNGENLSLSRESINNDAKRLQDAFDSGHTVLKIVSSFDNKYLQDLGVEKLKSTDFHKDVDEFKLRQAVQSGCLALADSLGYTDPVFVGSIQLDRDHPHAHIAMSETADKDLSNAKYYYDGYENGRLSTKNKDDMRNAIDHELEVSRSLVFFPSNSIEQAQNTNATYEKRYEILPIQKKAMLYVNLDDKDPAKDKYEDELIDSLLPHTSMNKRQLKTKLKEQKIPKSSDKKLPNLLANQILNDNQLAANRKRSAKAIAKLKKAKKKEKDQKDKEKRLNDALTYFKNRKENNPEEKELIENYVEPYYETALTNCANRIDYYRTYQFNPVQSVSKEDKDKHKQLIKNKKQAQTEFDKDFNRNQVRNQTIDWHQRKFVNSIEVAKNVRDPDYVPEPIEYAELHDLKKTIDSVDKFEKQLLPNAELAMSRLHETRQLQDYKLDLTLERMQQQNPVKPVPVKEVEPSEQKTITYKQADDMIFDLMN